MYVAKDLRQAEPRTAAAAQLAEVLRRFPSGPPVGGFLATCTCPAVAPSRTLQPFARRVHVLEEPANTTDWYAQGCSVTIGDSPEYTGVTAGARHLHRDTSAMLWMQGELGAPAFIDYRHESY